MKKAHLYVVAALAALCCSLLSTAFAQMGDAPHPRVQMAVSDAQRITLHGNTRGEAVPANDRGQVAEGLAMNHMQLLLKRSAEQQAALDSYVESLSQKNSPNYHRWLTAEQYGARYGVAQEDIDQVTAWLTSHGMKVNHVYANRMVIDFSGTAGQVRSAFGTEIHHIEAAGKMRVANMSDPQIPAALADVVTGVVSLHSFQPRVMHKMRSEYTFTSGSTAYHAITPADLATIYGLNKLFAAGYTGKGQTVVVIEDTNVYSTADFTTFRSAFGLSSYTSGSLVQVHPAPAKGTNNCANPGVLVGNDGEAILDAEYATAAAPNATIELASCADTVTTFGGLIALQNLLSTTAPPSVVSISYGECEAYMGAAANAVYSATYQQAAAMGVSVFVSAGDEGAASCDANASAATHGIGVSGFASTPYNVAVGGTDFGDTVAGTSATYWNTTNTSAYGSAKSYIPEIPWNDSCAGSLLAQAAGYSTTYGTAGFCNSATGKTYYLTTGSGSGGPSGCATGVPSVSGVVSGTCKGYAKPTWQTLLGVPKDGVRDLPDVSLFAANGVWGHYFVFCYSNPKGGGSACTGAPSGWAGAGGTSFSAPILAGVQALINQKWGKQGNPNPIYYAIANAQYGTTGSATCNSSNGNAVASTCVFYDVTKGDMDVNCVGKNNCYLPSGTNGVLSTTSASYSKAYGATTGWDFATGIGTFNAYNLVMNAKW